MVLRTYKTGTITMTGATDSTTLSNLTGRIKSIAIKPSGVSTDFRISTTKNGITEYILGSAGAVSVVAAGTIYYPLVLAQDIDTADYDTGGDVRTTEIVLDNNDLTIAVTDGADTETYSVDIIVEE
jgi:hypothetical protein